ncbi:ubiquitin-conjugating enzyme E2 J1-like [Ruditapes philippinarum]|uniref:ubiquitin-conjugating enzyme E2 J1-like n=1 Tax=Ruditapes philippinarum TaxID=129788 RepID=UPI00295BC8E4|nr:ubiquitin-conjugating enzyme E2 J1-like [Ruditapes philippinarum]
MQGMYSMRSPAVKRLMKEAQELREPTEQYACQPLEDNLFEWHFTIRGPADSEFDGGLYHGRIILPPEYPMKPPSIIILTPNGRFEVNKKICLSISGHHPESWQPSWSLRTALLAIIGFMPTHGAGALGSLDYSPDERKILAKRSQDYNCPSCGCIKNVLKEVTEESKKTTEEARELAAQISFKDEKEKNAALKSTTETSPTAEQVTPVADDTSGNGATASPSAVPQPGMTSQQFGQFPFRMPFFPPFPQMNSQFANTGVNTATQVPRFPLPFVSPFYPPMMQPGTFPMPPMMPGMQVPPWQHNTNITQPQSPASAAVPPRETTPTNIGSSTGQVNNSDNQTSNIEIPSPANSTTQNDENSSTSETPLTSQDGLRHRNVASASHTSTSHTHSHHRRFEAASTENREDQRVDRLLLLFAAFVVIVIALLLIRRLYIMKLIQFPL